jgi:leader peptidase (prepilin peptidase)/N-methyltransferase
MMTAAWASLAGFTLGATLASFLGLVADRLPQGRSIIAPRSSCSACGRTLAPLDLVPIVSFLAFRGRCRYCDVRLPARLLAVEVAFGLVVASLAAWATVHADTATFAVLTVWASFLFAAALIDLDTLELPDVLTLGGTATVALLTAMLAMGPVVGPTVGAGTWQASLTGMAWAAGSIVLINRLGGLALRRFRDTKDRLRPIGFDEVNSAAFAGAFAGLTVGLAVATAQALVKRFHRAHPRLPEPLLYATLPVAFLIAPIGVGLDASVHGLLAGAGLTALAGGVYWWWHDASAARAGRAMPTDEAEDPAADEPVAMGFGDVKLAALIGLMVGPSGWWVALFMAVTAGSIVGLTLRLTGGTRLVPFGPFLALGAWLTVLAGEPLLRLYLGWLNLTPAA